jgi:hypothetical protein
VVPETVYWNPALVLPAGYARIRFDVPEARGAVTVRIDGVDPEGRIGSATLTIPIRPASATQPTPGASSKR